MSYRKIGFVLIIVALSGCAYPQRVIHEELHTVYVAVEDEDSLVSHFAPVFLTYNHREPYNRIGRPSARFDETGNEQIYMDHHKPAIYHMTRRFSTEKGSYTNLIYRIHFPEVPFSLIPFHLTAGKNVGILFVVTIDEDQRPLLFTTAGTCGCYAAIVPTSYLPSDAFPVGWKNEPLKVYGERLPPLLNFQDKLKPKLVVHIRSGVHRVMDLEVMEKESLGNPGRFMLIKAPLVPVVSLEKIPIDGKTTSLYYDYWPLKGYVKDSFKPWESLFLSLISLDFFVGTDKTYGDSCVTGSPFYTSLKPWNRDSSDMWKFTRFLKFWGWRL